MAYCGQCGAKLPDGARFCAKCGHAVAVAAGPAFGAEPAPAAGGRPVAESAAQAVQELVGLVVREIDAPSAIGESTLCTWKNAGAGSAPATVASAATQALGGTAQRAVSAGAGKVGQGLAGETAKLVSRKATGRPPSQGGGAPAPSAKKSKLPVILVVAGTAVLVIALALYVVPLFIPHPYDPNSHVALTSDSSASASGSAASSSASASSASAWWGSSSASSASAEASSSSATSSASGAAASSGAATPAATPTGYSTDERPKIGEFKWLDGEAMKGNVPAGAKRIVDFGALTGGWKCYIVGNMEWLANADIGSGQAGATIAIDWYYIRIASGDAREDTTPTSTFTGTFDGGMLDATGSGRITIAAFWEKDGRQYATGSFMWPSGEIGTIALVRP